MLFPMGSARCTNGPLRSGAMADQILTLDDGSRVRLGDLPPEELRQLARLLRRAAEQAGAPARDDR